MPISKKTVKKIKDESFVEMNKGKNFSRKLTKMWGDENGFLCKICCPVENIERILDFSKRNGYDYVSFYVCYNKSKMSGKIGKTEYIGSVPAIEDNRAYYSENDFLALKDEFDSSRIRKSIENQIFKSQPKNQNVVEDNTVFDFDLYGKEFSF